MSKLFRYKILIFLFIICVGFQPLQSQTLNFKNYNIEDGLPQSYIMSIIQDSKGFMWFGTANGVSRYNGKVFKNFGKEHGLAESYVTAMFEDSKGNIWLGHEQNGISIYTANKDTFKTFKPDIKLPQARINKIIQDSKGVLWFATVGGGVISYNYKEAKVFTTKDGLINDYVFSIYEDKNGILWFATRTGISLYKDGKFKNLKNVPKLTPRCIIQDKYSNYWIGTFDTGIVMIENAFFFSDDSLEQQKYIHNFSKKDGLPDNLAYTLFKDSKNNIWCGLNMGGVIKFTADRNLQNIKYKVYNLTNGLASDKVWTIKEDREGNIWVGTIGGGVSQIRKGLEQFQFYSLKEGLPHKNVWSILEDAEQNVWFGTSDGLAKAHYKGNRDILTDFHTYKEKNGLKASNVYSLYKDKQDRVWIGTYGGGLALYLRDKNSFFIIDETKGLINNNIYSITQDREGMVWVSTEKGVSKIDPDTRMILKNYTTKNGLGYDAVMSLFTDSKGIIWFGTSGGGLSYFANDTIKTYNKNNGLLHETVYCITEDKKGNIWFGTEGGGIYKFDRKIFKNYITKDGLSADHAYLITTDNRGNIWAGTSKGIDKFDVKTNRFTHYGAEEGFLGIETNLNAVHKDPGGNLWFGTINGAVKYNPELIVKNYVEPVTHINGLKLQYKDIPFPRIHEFNYKNNHLTFEFIGISLTNPEKVRYQWMLEGFDDDWSPVSDQTYFTYSNLPPGKYSFKVKAANNDGVWNKKPAVYSFEILPPFYKRWWFYLLCLTFAILSLYLFIRMRTQKIITEKRILESKVTERTRELVKEKEKVEQVNKEVIAQKTIIEQKNKDITDSIKYAKQIQEAILPDKEKIYNKMPDSFILFMPKDIVSGDFYWFESKDNKVIIAAVDCTGHGVPGAFMSMIGNTLLNEIVNEKGVTEPAKILTQLNIEVRAALKQESAAAETKDGMDVAICTIDIENKTLEFAGAYRPLYFLRNNEIIEVKGDRYPIGGAQEESTRIFTNHKFNLIKDDSMYLFSDGYIDQFGGNEGKKFLAKRFKDLILQHKDKKMHEQNEIFQNNFINWRGNYEQIDDVLLIGVRFHNQVI